MVAPSEDLWYQVPESDDIDTYRVHNPNPALLQMIPFLEAVNNCSHHPKLVVGLPRPAVEFETGRGSQFPRGLKYPELYHIDTSSLKPFLVSNDRFKDGGVVAS